MLNFSISYWDLIKISYFADTTERGDRGWKQAQRQGEEKVTLQITLLCRVKFEEVMCSKNEGLLLLKALVEGGYSTIKSSFMNSLELLPCVVDSLTNMKGIKRNFYSYRGCSMSLRVWAEVCFL
jgi:hypothetical protein